MPCQIHLESFGESRGAVIPAKFSILTFSFMLFFGVATTAAAAPVITSATTASGIVGTAFSYQITATSSPTGYRYGAAGLPSGLTVNSNSGLISGTPTVAGTSTVTLSATSGYRTARATLTLTITGAAAPRITSATTASGTVGRAFTYQIAATNAPTSYGATGLPAGLTVNSGTGLISGTFTTAGTSTVTLSATNRSGTGHATLTLTTVSTSGAGTSISPSSLAFGNDPVDTSSASQVATLTNSGTAALAITSIAFTGANAADFSEVNTCGASLAAGAHCTIAISFDASATGSRAASLTVSDSTSGSPQTVSLSGTGTHDVILTWTANTSSGIEGYNVFRGTTSGGESKTPLNSSPISGTTYTDVNVQPGQKYYYVVTAVSSNGTTQSADSSEASATVPTP